MSPDRNLDAVNLNNKQAPPTQIQNQTPKKTFPPSSFKILRSPSAPVPNSSTNSNKPIGSFQKLSELEPKGLPPLQSSLRPMACNGCDRIVAFYIPGLCYLTLALSHISPSQFNSKRPVRLAGVKVFTIRSSLVRTASRSVLLLLLLLSLLMVEGSPTPKAAARVFDRSFLNLAAAIAAAAEPVAVTLAAADWAKSKADCSAACGPPRPGPVCARLGPPTAVEWAL